MPRFNPDLDQVHANVPIYDKGKYELVVKEVTGYAGIQKDKTKQSQAIDDHGNKLSLGARVRFEMVGKVASNGKVDEALKGDRVSDNTLWIHNKASREMTKRALMPIFGYTNDDEDEFNKWYAKQDFGIDVANGDEEGKYVLTLGTTWGQLVGHHVRVDLDKKIYENEKAGTEEEQQNFAKWAPVPKAPVAAKK